MTAYIALLRAVNVGGTGKLPMTELKNMCEAAGFKSVRTYIASGNVVFTSDRSEDEVRTAIGKALHAYAGKSVGVMIRTAVEMAETLLNNPFAGQPNNRTVAFFVDGHIPVDALDDARNVGDEQMRIGDRAIYVFYGAGMANSRRVIPAASSGTARNMNTVAKLAEMAAGLG